MPDDEPRVTFDEISRRIREASGRVFDNMGRGQAIGFFGRTQVLLVADGGDPRIIRDVITADPDEVSYDVGNRFTAKGRRWEVIDVRP